MNRKATTFLSFMLLIAIVLVSCGTRPLEKHERPIVGVYDTTGLEDTDPAVTRRPFVYDPLAIPAHYTSIRSIIGDPEYVKKNTVGVYYIQNKQSGRVLTPDTDALFFLFEASYDDPTYRYWKHYPHILLMDLMEWDCQKFLLLKLEQGMYAILSYATYTDNMWGNEEHTALVDARRMLAPDEAQFESQAMIIRKTASGAFTIVSRYYDRMGINCVIRAANAEICRTMGPDSKIYESSLMDDLGMYSYTDDTDYSDEWLFIPVDGSPEFDP